MTTPRKYAVLGSTGNCGTALIENLLKNPDSHIHAYCRNRTKLLRLLPDIEQGGRATLFEGSISDVPLLSSCIRGCRAVFLVVSTNDNIPGCRVAQDTAAAVVQALQELRRHQQGDARAAAVPVPKLVLLSSGSVDPQFSLNVPWLIHAVVVRSASHVYRDLVVTERLLRAEEDWLTSIYVKPGALSVDIQRGHNLSLTEGEAGALSYSDLAAGMIEAVDDEDGRYDMKNVSVLNANGSAKFPSGTPMCILMGLLRHFFPFLHPYLPSTGPG